MLSSSRGNARVSLLAIHTTEGILRAIDLRAWKSWPGSAHASADQYGTLLDGAGDGFVDYSKASWTLRSGNAISDNIELCALAKWTRADWLARPKLIELSAVWLAKRKAARPWIPLVKLTPAEVRAGRSGVIGHVDWTEGMKDGSHWDPGAGYPWDLVMAHANQLAGGKAVVTSPATPAPPAAPAPRPSWEDAMYISCESRNFTGLLSGGILTGLGGAEVTDAAQNIAKGAPRQWVTSATLDELIRKSQRLVRDI